MKGHQSPVSQHVCSSPQQCSMDVAGAPVSSNGAAASKGPSFLQNLFRTSSREASSSEDEERQCVREGKQRQDGLEDKLKGSNKKDSPASSSSPSAWRLARRSSQKKDKKPSRLAAVTSRKEVVGAVEDEWPMYSGLAEDYELGEPIGYGATSIVRIATYKTLGQVVAVKQMEFEGKASILMMQREVQLMSLSKHPNILRVRGDWVTGSHLCIATRFIPPGSLLDILEYSFQEGLDEVACATILKQAGEGMNYLHINGWLHRDIKAANLLVDEDGTILISDFGCSSQVFENGNPAFERNTRKSFVGTPCWMAPEVVEQKPYDSKADIWSFGITAIEIATGRAPHALYTPAQILLKTVAEKPPTLDMEGHANPFSKHFRDMIDSCLKKEPAKRSTAEQLLTHHFFKQAKRKQHLVGALLAGLPRLQDRQTRRSRNSLRVSTRGINGSVWDFESSPLFDQFKGFTMNGAFSVPPSPAHSRLSSNNVDEPGYPLGGSPRRRRKESSIASHHRRGMSVSFDAVAEAEAPEEPDPTLPVQKGAEPTKGE